MPRGTLPALLIISVVACGAGADSGAPAATVNGVSLATWEAERELQHHVTSTSYHRGINPDTRRRLRQEALDELVLKELKRQWLEREHPEALDSDVAVTAWQGIRDRFPSDEEYLAALAKIGADDAGFRHAFVRDEAAAAADRVVLATVGAPSADEVASFFAQHREDYVVPEARRLVHAFFPVAPSQPETAATAEAAARELVRRAAAGETTVLDAALASRDQLPPRYRSEIGDLGFLHRGSLDPAVEAEVFAAAPGSVVGPVRSLHGFHVVEVAELRPSAPLAFTEVADAVAARLLEQRRDAAVTSFENGLVAKAEIGRSGWVDGP